MDDFQYNDDKLEQDSEAGRERKSVLDRINETEENIKNIKDKYKGAKEFKQKLRDSNKAKDASNIGEKGLSNIGRSPQSVTSPITGPATGYTGAGTAGAAGAAGAAGTTGAAGAAGTAGAVGTAGTAGAVGTAGAAGTVGTAGTAGAAAASTAATTGVAVGSGFATGGITTAAFAAKETIKIPKKYVEKKTEQVTGINVKKTKRTAIIIIVAVILGIFLLFIPASAMWLTSETMYDDVFSLIERREKRYAEPGKAIKPLLLMDNSEIASILIKDYKEQDGTIDTSYRTYLKELYNQEFDEYMPDLGINLGFDLDIEKDDPYAVKLFTMGRYLAAERDNFNKINWNIVDVAGNRTSVPTVVKKNLKMPDLKKYKYSPNATEEQVQDMYIDMVRKHLQMWVIPHSLNIASQDTKFGQDIAENMWHPITVDLFKLDRLTKTTIREWNLKIKVEITRYEKPKSEEESLLDDFREWEKVGETEVLYNSTASKYKNETIINDTVDKKTEYKVTLLKNEYDEYIPVDRKDGGTDKITRNSEAYRYVPKATEIQDFYNIIKAKYRVQGVDESQSPIEKNVTLDANGKEVITEIWDEELLTDGTDIDTYKVSYVAENQYEKLGRKISRVEWYLDYGTGKHEMFPKKESKELEELEKKYGGEKPKITPYSYIDLDFGYQQIEKYFDWIESRNITGSGELQFGYIPDGGFLWPVPELLEKRGKTIDNFITSKFGMRWHPIDGEWKFHGGMDIGHDGIGNPGKNKATSYGPSIYASQNGTISLIRNSGNTGYGKYVVVDHHNGFFTLYGHLYSISVTNGQSVSMGDIIGVMGTTGSSTGVHLHYEIIEASNINQIFNKANKRDPRLYFHPDGSSILSSGEGMSDFGQKTIGTLVEKAISMAANPKIQYNQGSKDKYANTLSNLDRMTATDCSGLVYSLFKVYLDIDVGTTSAAIIAKGRNGYTQNGWKAQVAEYNKDTSVLKPGDILYRTPTNQRSGHVGIYVGDKKQVDHGGPGRGFQGTWLGPKHKEVSDLYTHYIRYTHPDAYKREIFDMTFGTETSHIKYEGDLYQSIFGDPQTLRLLRFLVAGEVGYLNTVNSIYNDIDDIGSYKNSSQNISLLNRYVSRKDGKGFSWNSLDYQFARVAVVTNVINRVRLPKWSNNFIRVMEQPRQYATITGRVDRPKAEEQYRNGGEMGRKAIDAAIKVAIENADNNYYVIGDVEFFSADWYMLKYLPKKTRLFNISGNTYYKN